VGSIGDYFDSAVVEALKTRMQVELLNGRRSRTRIELANAIVEYLEDLPQSITPSLPTGMLTVIEYQRTHHNQPTIALATQAS
jgi:hypothetical protein